jgi:hypothetical protein
MSIKSKLAIFETGLLILISLNVLGLGFYFFSIIFPGDTKSDPFHTYNNNPGIIRISIASIASQILFIILFLVLSAESYRNNAFIKAAYLFLALVIGFLTWYELYYGSTFYYGEVRDKQGLMFPWIASLLATLVIWKINYSKEDTRNVKIKIAATALVNVGLYVLWLKVYEPWNLWQS